MTEFVKTICGKYVRVDTVREARSFEDESTALLCLEGGAEVKATWETWLLAVWRSNCQMVPARRGTFIIHTDQNGDLMVREHVIGWAIGGSGFTSPVTTRGVRYDADYNPLIEHPDGTVQDVLGIHDSYDHWLQDLRAQRALDVATVAARAKGLN